MAAYPGPRYSAVTDVFGFSPAGVWIQSHRLTRAIEVSIDGGAFTDTVALEIFDTNGNLIVTGSQQASRVASNKWAERLVGAEGNESQ